MFILTRVSPSDTQGEQLVAHGRSEDAVTAISSHRSQRLLAD